MNNIKHKKKLYKQESPTNFTLQTRKREGDVHAFVQLEKILEDLLTFYRKE